MKEIENFHNWFALIPKHIQEEIQSRFVLKTYEPGCFLYKNGDSSNASFQIETGKIKICNFSHQGQEYIISYLLSGDWCGDIGLINGTNRFNNAIAVERTQAKLLIKDDFLYIYNKYPEVPKAINIMLCSRLQSALSVLEDASLLPLSFKLARTLCRLGSMVGTESDTDGSCIITPFSHDELGRLVGATRQSVSRELKLLENEGLIELKYSKLIIKNLKSFSEQFDDLLGYEPIVATYSDK